MNDLTKIIPRAYNFFCEIKPFLNYSILNLNDKENYCVRIDDDFLNGNNGFKENSLENKLKKYIDDAVVKYIDESVVPDLELHVENVIYSMGIGKKYDDLVKVIKKNT